MNLNTEHTKEGVKLTLENGSDAGILAPYCDGNGPIYWQFMYNDKCIGPMRSHKISAEYDALAYWAENT